MKKIFLPTLLLLLLSSCSVVTTPTNTNTTGATQTGNISVTERLAT